MAIADITFSPEELATEQWRPVVGYEGYYSVSTLGRVRREKASTGTMPGKILRPRLVKGYLRLGLHKERACKHLFVHRLVAESFIGLMPAGFEVNHINLIKTDNRLQNLEYLTPSENLLHAVRSGRQLGAKGLRNGVHTHPERRSRGEKHSAIMKIATPRGENNGSSKLTAADVIQMRQIYSGQQKTYKEIAEKFNISQMTAYKAINKITWKHID